MTADIAERKMLLATRAELDRIRLTIAVREVKTIVMPARRAVRVAALRPMAVTAVGVLLPLLGLRRIRRWIRIASLGLTIFRIAHNWRASQK